MIVCFAEHIVVRRAQKVEWVVDRRIHGQRCHALDCMERPTSWWYRRPTTTAHNLLVLRVYWNASPRWCQQRWESRGHNRNVVFAEHNCVGRAIRYVGKTAWTIGAHDTVIVQESAADEIAIASIGRALNCKIIASPTGAGIGRTTCKGNHGREANADPTRVGRVELRIGPPRSRWCGWWIKVVRYRGQNVIAFDVRQQLNEPVAATRRVGQRQHQVSGGKVFLALS